MQYHPKKMNISHLTRRKVFFYMYGLWQQIRIYCTQKWVFLEEPDQQMRFSLAVLMNFLRFTVFWDAKKNVALRCNYKRSIAGSLLIFAKNEVISSSNLRNSGRENCRYFILFVVHINLCSLCVRCEAKEWRTSYWPWIILLNYSSSENYQYEKHL